MFHRRHSFFVILPALATLVACGVDRRLRILSEPAGAEVSVDGRIIGETPVEYHYTHYGTHRIYISRKGYKSTEREVNLEAPWYGQFPFDVVSEVIFPVWRTDFRDEHFSLATQNEQLTPEERAALDAANLKLEEGALTRMKALRRWAPGDTIPEMPKTASAPARQ